MLNSHSVGLTKNRLAECRFNHKKRRKAKKSKRIKQLMLKEGLKESVMGDANGRGDGSLEGFTLKCLKYFT